MFIYIFFPCYHTFIIKLVLYYYLDLNFQMETERLSNDLDGQNFVNLKYDPSKSTGHILLDNPCDLGLNFYKYSLYLKISILF